MYFFFSKLSILFLIFLGEGDRKSLENWVGQKYLKYKHLESKYRVHSLALWWYTWEKEEAVKFCRSISDPSFLARELHGTVLPHRSFKVSVYVTKWYLTKVSCLSDILIAHLLQLRRPRTGSCSFHYNFQGPVLWVGFPVGLFITIGIKSQGWRALA